VPGLVAEEDDADDGGRHRLGQHHRRGGHRHAAAFQRGGVEHERDDASRGDRVSGRVTGQLKRLEAGQDAGGDAEHAVAEPGHQAERGGPVGLVELGRGHAHHGQARDRHDERELEHRAHLRGALGARRGAEQAHAGHHPENGRPLPPGQIHADHPGGHHGRHRQVRRHEGLDREKREPVQRDELRHEPERVQAHAHHEPPLTQQPDDQARIDAPGRVIGGLVAGRPNGDRLHHGGDAVQQRRDDRRDEAD
jgi:hypothetical protein